MSSSVETGREGGGGTVMSSPVGAGRREGAQLCPHLLRLEKGGGGGGREHIDDLTC